MISSVKRFRDWDLQLPFPERYGEWEVNYPEWQEIYFEVKEILKKEIFEWDNEMVKDLIYIIARDNECEIISDSLIEYPEKIEYLLKECLKSKDSDCKWQLVARICETPIWNEEIEKIIYEMYFDKDYYVQRICLMELGKKKSNFTIELAKFSWGTYDEYQRISVLWALYYFGYKEIIPFINVALSSNMLYLKKNAEEILEKIKAT